jgi:hypothetical protein
MLQVSVPPWIYFASLENLHDDWIQQRDSTINNHFNKEVEKWMSDSVQVHFNVRTNFTSVRIFALICNTTEDPIGKELLHLYVTF